MILSITVYTLVGVMLFYFGWHYNKRFSLSTEYHTTKQFLLSWEIIASFVLFSLITGLRYHTGWDHECYIQDYVQYQNEGTLYRPDFEPGFRLIETIFAKLGFHYSFFFGFFGFVNIFFIYFALRKQRSTIPWVGLCTMMGIYYLHLINSLRQGIVECVFVSLILLVEHKKYLLYFIFAILLSLIHKVALLIIPLFFIAHNNYQLKYRWSLLIVYFVFFIIGQFPELIFRVVNACGDLISYYGYKKYIILLNTNSYYAFRRTPFGIISIIIMIIHLFLIYFYPKLKEEYKGNAFFAMSFKLCFAYMCYYVLVQNTAFYFKRPSELMMPFFIITISYLLSYFVKHKQTRLLTVFLVLNISIIIITHIKLFFNYYQDTTSLYHFIPIN